MTDHRAGGAGGCSGDGVPFLELVPEPDAGTLAAARLAVDAAGLGGPDLSAAPYTSHWRQAGLREGVAAADGLCAAAAQHAGGGAGVVES